MPAAARFLHTLIFFLAGMAVGSLSPANDLPTTPTRIISCAPNLTETLFALGAGDSVIGVTRYCQFPAEAKALPKYGDLYNPSLEAMVAARPDMIALLPGNDKVMEYFRDRKDVRLLPMINPESISEIEGVILDVGKAIGRHERAKELVRNTRVELEKIREANAEKRRPRVLIVIGREKGTLANLYAAGHDTYLTELLDVINADNVVDDPKLGRYPVLSREALLRYNPDIIIETHHDADDEVAREDIARAWKTLPMLNAVKQKKIAVLTDKHVLVPGPFLEGSARHLEELVRE